MTFPTFLGTRKENKRNQGVSIYPSGARGTRSFFCLTKSAFAEIHVFSFTRLVLKLKSILQLQLTCFLMFFRGRKSKWRYRGPELFSLAVLNITCFWPVTSDVFFGGNIGSPLSHTAQTCSSHSMGSE